MLRKLIISKTCPNYGSLINNELKGLKTDHTARENIVADFNLFISVIMSTNSGLMI